MFELLNCSNMAIYGHRCQLIAGRWRRKGRSRRSSWSRGDRWWRDWCRSGLACLGWPNYQMHSLPHNQSSIRQSLHSQNISLQPYIISIHLHPRINIDTPHPYLAAPPEITGHKLFGLRWWRRGLGWCWWRIGNGQRSHIAPALTHN